jgi:hypothetical protein
MKKYFGRKEKKNMQAHISVSATFHEHRLLGELVEKLAYLRPEMGYCVEQVHPGWRAIESSSVEAFVSGKVGMSDGKDFISISFVSSFFFTSIRSNKENYTLRFSNSLS